MNETVLPVAHRIEDQRKIPRIRETIPVTLIPLFGGMGLGRIPGELRDFHDEAACVKTSKRIAVGRKVRVRLRVPRSVDYSYQGLPCEVTARVESVRAVDSGDDPSFAVVIRWDRSLARSLGKVIRS